GIAARLDLDHIGAEVGQVARADRTGPTHRQVDDAEALKGSVAFGEGVILSGAKDLMEGAMRSFAALRMTTVVLAQLRHLSTEIRWGSCQMKRRARRLDHPGALFDRHDRFALAEHLLFHH